MGLCISWRRLKSAVSPFPPDSPIEEGAVCSLGLCWSILPLASSQPQCSFCPHCSPRTAPSSPEILQGVKSKIFSTPHLPALFLQAGNWETPSSFWEVLTASKMPQFLALLPSHVCAQFCFFYLICKSWYSPWLRSRHFSLTFPFLLHNNQYILKSACTVDVSYKV